MDDQLHVQEKTKRDEFRNMVFVFKTNVLEFDLAQQLTSKLLSCFPHCKINFDLEDCDKILRVEGHEVQPEKVIEVLTVHGIECHSLE